MSLWSLYFRRMETKQWNSQVECMHYEWVTNKVVMHFTPSVSIIYSWIFMLQVLEEHQLSCMDLLLVNTDSIILTKHSKFHSFSLLCSSFFFINRFICMISSSIMHFPFWIDIILVIHNEFPLFRTHIWNWVMPQTDLKLRNYKMFECWFIGLNSRKHLDLFLHYLI